ncbi:MAG TPA: hypothetical protein VE291_02025, partial [Terracidiphilus sp.]|nr:hypothetical protein [Terracidiphilus sp.]
MSHEAGTAVRFRIRALIAVAAMAGATGLSCPAAQPEALTSIRAIRALSQEESRARLPVAFEGTVTYYNAAVEDLFVQDAGRAIYVETKPNQNMVPGDRVLVRGKTRSSFHTDIVAETVTVLHHGALPEPVNATFEQLIRA